MVPMSFRPSLTGDGLVLAAELGAVIHRDPGQPFDHARLHGAGRRREAADKLPRRHRRTASPHTLLVNRRGRRFADELFFQGIVPHLRTFDALRHEHPNVPCYLIFDRQYPDNYSFANRPAGSPVPEAVARADTIAALGGKACDRSQSARGHGGALQWLCASRRRRRLSSR